MRPANETLAAHVQEWCDAEELLEGTADGAGITGASRGNIEGGGVGGAGVGTLLFDLREAYLEVNPDCWACSAHGMARAALLTRVGSPDPRASACCCSGAA